MTASSPCKCYLVRRDPQGTIQGCVETIGVEDLPAGEVLLRVAWSSLNYKDALAARGHAGVVRQWPHVPGIDAAGQVVESTAVDWTPGQRALVTGYELGAGQWGGWSQLIRVPANWLVPLPDSLSLREAMILGTAGLTAAQCTWRLQKNGILPETGPVLVTGASGGVGSLAVKLLSQLGYQVVASTGKRDAEDWLRELGADQVLSREDVLTKDDRPLATARWAGAVDTVGGPPLAAVIRHTQLHGCVTACGLVAGTDLPLTVYPFLLRGITLAGVTSQNCPPDLRRTIWARLATDWRMHDLDRLAREVVLEAVDRDVERILAGAIRGRVVVRLSGIE